MAPRSDHRTIAPRPRRSASASQGKADTAPARLTRPILLWAVTVLPLILPLQPGADRYDARQVYAIDFPEEAAYPWNPADPEPDLPGEGYESGETFTQMTIDRDGGAHRKLPPLKLHAEVTKGNWDIWARYTRGGQQLVPDSGTILHYPWGWGDWVTDHNGSAGYQQATAYVGYERLLPDELAEAHREDEYYAKVLLNWRVNDHHELALGSEYSHEEFSLSSPGYPDGPIRQRPEQTKRLCLLLAITARTRPPWDCH